MGKYFGTDGFRGEANVQLTANHAFQVGRYVGWYYGRDHKAKIVIGKDTRRSSYMFEYALDQASERKRTEDRSRGRGKDRGISGRQTGRTSICDKRRYRTYR